MAITMHKAAKLNLDKFAYRVGGFNQAKGPDEAKVGDTTVSVTGGFCNGACHHWVHRAVLGGQKGFDTPSKKIEDKPEVREARRQEKLAMMGGMAATQAAFFEAKGGEPKNYNVTSDAIGKSLGLAASGGKPSFGMECDYTKDVAGARRPTWKLKGQMIDAIGNNVKDKLSEPRCPGGCVLGFQFQNDGHAVAVVKQGITYNATNLIMYYFFDPNLGIWIADEGGLRQILNYLFGTLPLANLTWFGVRVPVANVGKEALQKDIVGAKIPAAEFLYCPTKQHHQLAFPLKLYETVAALKLPYVKKGEPVSLQSLGEDAWTYSSVVGEDNRPYYAEEEMLMEAWNCATLKPRKEAYQPPPAAAKNPGPKGRVDRSKIMSGLGNT